LLSPNHTSPNPALNPSDIPLPTWYLTSSFAGPEAYEAFDKLLQPLLHLPNAVSSSRCWQPEVEPGTGDEDFAQPFDFATASVLNHWTLQDLSELVNQTSKIAEAEISQSVDITFVAVGSIYVKQV
jgi:pre-rRNA-processing protein IPI1